MSKNWWACVAVCLVAGSRLPAQDAPPVAEAPATVEDVRPTAGTLWFRGDYLLWKVKGASAPALVGTIPESQAELIQQFPSTTITPLFGGSAFGIDYRPQSGVRFDAGVWLDEDRQLGLGAGFFQLQQGRQAFAASSQAAQPLGPVFSTDPSLGQQTLIMDAVPGLRAGGVSVQATQHLWGAEVNAMRRLSAGGVLDHLDVLVGIRHVQFGEGLLIQGTSQSIPGGRLPCG
jgi:hypothetical protein